MRLRFESKRGPTIAVGLAALVMAAGALLTPAAAATQYVIGLANNVVGNGWRDEMGCSVKAQARAAGLVSKVIDASANGSASDEIQAIRSLISAGVNAIIVNPANAQALNPVIAEAHAKGIVVVSVDSTVTAPEAYNFTNDQTAYGRISGEWLVHQLNGNGTILELRGAAGSSADTDRHAGFEKAVSGHPGIKVVSVFTNWSIATASQQVTQELASGAKIDGIFTPGTGQVVWNAYKAANKPFVPTAVSDNNGDLAGFQIPGATFIAVGNPAVVGGGGVTVALNVLQGKPQDKVVAFTPTAWDSTTPDGLAAIKAAWDSRYGDYYSTMTSIPDYTTFTKADLLACQGP
jgi:ribose transport system substrate-binding protein